MLDISSFILRGLFYVIVCVYRCIYIWISIYSTIFNEFFFKNLFYLKLFVYLFFFSKKKKANCLNQNTHISLADIRILLDLFGRNSLIKSHLRNFRYEIKSCIKSLLSGISFELLKKNCSNEGKNPRANNNHSSNGIYLTFFVCFGCPLW